MENLPKEHHSKSPVGESRLSKQTATKEKSSRLLSFKWFLRKEKTPPGKASTDLRESSSGEFCPTDRSLLTGGRDKRNSGFWQKLCSFTSRSRSPSCYGPKFTSASRLLKTSFSSGDVARLRTTTVATQGRSSSASIANSWSCYEVLSPTAALPCSAPHQEQTEHLLPTTGSRLPLRDPDARRRPSPARGTVQHGDAIWNDGRLDLMLCKLCLTMIPVGSMYQLRACGCLFCHSCLHQYFTINIREGGIALTCPDADCHKEGFIDATEVEKLVDSDIYDMFKRLAFDREIEMDPSRTWCPGAGCETVCYVRPSSDPSRGTPTHCPSCFLTFCSLCKQKWHSNRTCLDVQRELLEDEFPLPGDEDAPIKRCPNCRVPIERDEGCAQMMCKRCKHVFCWYCLTSLDDDFLLRHYDKGPCKNKLGHSRASVVWHRTQVVSIFAGFGFLLLVASPVLLLVAPCLLCCRCKHCSKLLEDEPTSV